MHHWNSPVCWKSDGYLCRFLPLSWERVQWFQSRRPLAHQRRRTTGGRLYPATSQSLFRPRLRLRAKRWVEGKSTHATTKTGLVVDRFLTLLCLPLALLDIPDDDVVCRGGTQEQGSAPTSKHHGTDLTVMTSQQQRLGEESHCSKDHLWPAELCIIQYSVGWQTSESRPAVL